VPWEASSRPEREELVFKARLQDEIADAAALMAIRPEAVVVNSSPVSRPENALPGEVHSREFLSATVRLSIATALGTFMAKGAIFGMPSQRGITDFRRVHRAK
jgi:hypothetical protein